MTQHDMFDQQIRSMLAGAEEPVPSGVWKAVSGALDAKARRAAVLVVFRRAFLGVAAAAAILVAALFLFRPASETAPVAATLAEVTADEATAARVVPEVRVSEAPVSEAQAALLATATPSARPDRSTARERVRSEAVPTAITAVEPEAAPEAAPATEADSAAEATPAAEAKSTAETEPTPHSSATIVEIRPASDRANDRLEWMDEAEWLLEENDSPAPRRRLTLGAGSNVESNYAPEQSIPTLRRASARRLTKTTVTEHGDNSAYSIPLSFGLSLQWHFSEHWALGTGVSYTYLGRSFDGTYTEFRDGLFIRSITGRIDNGLHYVGVPLNLYYYLPGSGRTVGFYGFGGASFEKGVANRFRIKDEDGDIIYRHSIDGVQVSFALGLGIRFQLAPRISLYLDPSLRYYLENGQPKSIRTAQPLMMNLEAGLRFDL